MLKKRVTGFGGIFFKAKDREKLGAWYKKHLGLAIEPWGGVVFRSREADDPDRKHYLVWSPFEEDTDYFAPSEKPFMFNFRVENLKALLAQLKKEGVEVDSHMEESENGKFGWIMDLEGNRVELWEPPALKKEKKRRG